MEKRHEMIYFSKKVEGKHHVRNGTVGQALDNFLVDNGNSGLKQV
jgi:hypothetical protein